MDANLRITYSLLHRGCILVAFSLLGCNSQAITTADVDGPRKQDKKPATITFSQHIAPIVFDNCATCHRPKGSAPFSLLGYDDVQKRAAQIVDVIERRYMPPWPPEVGPVEFVGQRVLSQDQIDMTTAWEEQGRAEGDPRHLPPLPRWNDQWQLGTPDLTLTMPDPFTLPADPSDAGRLDVYRKFVIPTDLKQTRWVKAIELQPGNRRIVHHALILVDRTSASRRLDAQDDEPGFGGMDAYPASSPGPNFLSWQPGRLPYDEDQQMAWRLDPGTDIVLQLHMQTTGKPEIIQSSVGLHFTQRPPPNYVMKICLRSVQIDIPAGGQHEFTQRFELPVDVEVLGVLPHAHYVGKELTAVATLPNGTTRPLLRILDWDFNWQSDYRYATPIELPRGTVIEQHFTFDNAADNPRNPHVPPRRVVYGPNSLDEMGELWLQLRLRNHQDMVALGRQYGRYVLEKALQVNSRLLKRNPDDVSANMELAKAFLQLGRIADAEQRLQRVIRIDPANPDGHYLLGNAWLRRGRPEEAIAQLNKALELDAEHFEAHHDLGLLKLKPSSIQESESHLRRAVQISPYDPVALANLGRSLLMQNKRGEAADCLRRSLDIRPEHAATVELLREAEGQRR